MFNESGLDKKIKNLATKEEIETTKTELKTQQYKIVKLQTYDLSLFISQTYFVNDGAQLYLILQLPNYTELYFKDKVILKKLYNGNLKVYGLEIFLFLPLLMIIFLRQLSRIKIQIFV